MPNLSPTLSYAGRKTRHTYAEPEPDTTKADNTRRLRIPTKLTMSNNPAPKNEANIYHPNLILRPGQGVSVLRFCFRPFGPT